MYNKQDIYKNCSNIMKRDKSIFIVTQCQLIDFYSSLFTVFKPLYRQTKTIYCLENLYNALSTIEPILESTENKNNHLLGLSAITKIMKDKERFYRWLYRDVYIIIRRRDLQSYTNYKIKEKEYMRIMSNNIEPHWAYSNVINSLYGSGSFIDDRQASYLVHKSEFPNYEDLIFPADIHYTVQVIDKVTEYIFYTTVINDPQLRHQYINVTSIRTSKGDTFLKMHKTMYKLLTYDKNTKLFDNDKKMYKHLADNSVISSDKGPITFDKFIDSYNRYVKRRKREDIDWVL